MERAKIVSFSLKKAPPRDKVTVCPSNLEDGPKPKLSLQKYLDDVEDGIKRAKVIIEGLLELPGEDDDKDYDTNIKILKVYEDIRESVSHINKFYPKSSQQLGDKCRNTLKDNTELSIPSLKEDDDQYSLKIVADAWDKFNKLMTKYDGLFSIIQTEPPLRKVVQEQFNNQVYEEHKLNIYRIVCDWIYHEREGQLIDRPLIGRVISMLKKMDPKYFESTMLEAAVSYYSKKASQTYNSFSDQLLEVENCLAMENEIASHYLPEKKSELVEAVLNGLLLKPDRVLMNLVHGIQHSIRDNKKEDICRIHRLSDDMPDGLALVIITFIVEFLMDELELLVEELDLVRAS